MGDGRWRNVCNVQGFSGCDIALAGRGGQAASGGIVPSKPMTLAGASKHDGGRLYSTSSLQRSRDVWDRKSVWTRCEDGLSRHLLRRHAQNRKDCDHMRKRRHRCWGSLLRGKAHASDAPGNWASSTKRRRGGGPEDTSKGRHGVSVERVAGVERECGGMAL
ncbi:hypothetical protein BKA81DRAFT_34255 [Phyllosticta paracitricarpa]